MTTTTQTGSELSRVAGHCVTALKYLVAGRGLAKKTKTLPIEAEAALSTARKELGEAISGLQAQGIRPEEMPEPEEIPLHLLGSPNNRRLLAILEEAQLAAERVDAERGRVLPDHVPLQPGESRGTDLAEAISYLRLRVSLEVHGPAGRE